MRIMFLIRQLSKYSKYSYFCNSFNNCQIIIFFIPCFEMTSASPGSFKRFFESRGAGMCCFLLRLTACVTAVNTFRRARNSQRTCTLAFALRQSDSMCSVLYPLPARRRKMPHGLYTSRMQSESESSSAACRRPRPRARPTPPTPGVFTIPAACR